MERCSLKHRRKVSEELSSPPSESPCLSGSFRKTPRTVCASRLDYLSKDSLVNKAGARGFLNLWTFLVWDPIMRYGETGTLIDLTLARLMFKNVSLLLFLWFQCFTFAFIAFFTFRLFARRRLSRTSLRWIQCVSQLFLVVYSVSICLMTGWTILPCAFALIVTFISVMKMHSFTESQVELFDAHVACLLKRCTNKFDDGERSQDAATTECDSSESQDQAAAATGPPDSRTVNNPHYSEMPLEHDADTLSKNVALAPLYEGPTFSYFAYYMFCPVLVYEPCYPCGPPLRWTYFLRKVLEMLATMNALYIISVRYLIPIVRSSPEVPLVFGLVKLIWPMFFSYLLIFYLLFECICNLLAEITRFGDRDFYHDWWNSTTWDEFARKWNRPVHEFLLRHVYYKTRTRLKMSKHGASIMTFLVSALFHELIMAVCFKTLRFWMFGIMMLQIPLIGFGHFHQGTDIGNCFFWMGMILGIPLISISYGRGYTMDLSKTMVAHAA